MAVASFDELEKRKDEVKGKFDFIIISLTPPTWCRQVLIESR
jgi:hypothetical protein